MTASEPRNSEPQSSGRRESSDTGVAAVTDLEDEGHRPMPRSWMAIVSYIGLGTLISGTAQMLRGLLPILATQYAGLSEAETGVVYTASTLVVMFSGPLFGWLSDNVSHKLVLMVSAPSCRVTPSIRRLGFSPLPAFATT